MTERLELPRSRSVPLDRAVVMGIVNCTPDSFFSSSRRRTALEAAETALRMEREGAAIVDIGGESTRPGAAYVDEAEETARVVPAVLAIRERSDLPISVDTRKSAVARAALDAGADIINDISAFEDDPSMASLAAERGVPAILMHKKGIPASMQDGPYYSDCPEEVYRYLLGRAEAARRAGVRQIVLDPGIGFGKRLEDNLALLSSLDRFIAAGYPVLVGLSRKSFVGALVGKDADDRLFGSLGAACAAWCGGARIFRVHDVAATRDALTVFQAAFEGAVRPSAE